MYFISRYFGGVLFARFSGYLIKSRYLTLLSGRKIFNTVSQVSINSFFGIYLGCIFSKKYFFSPPLFKKSFFPTFLKGFFS